MPAATRWAFGPSEPASRYFPRAQPACTSSIRLLQRPLPTPNAQYQAQRIASAFGRPSPMYSARSTYSASHDLGSTSASSSFGWPRPNDPLFFHVRMAQSSVRLHRGGEVWAAERLNRRIGRTMARSSSGGMIAAWPFGCFAQHRWRVNASASYARPGPLGCPRSAHVHRHFAWTHLALACCRLLPPDLKRDCI